MADGSRQALYIVKETEYGVTPQNPALDTLRSTGCTVGLNKDALQSNEIRDDRQIADFRLGTNQVGGEVPFELSYGTHDELLAAALMATGWETDSPVAGTDRIKTGVNRTSFTLIRYFADIPDKPYLVCRGVEISTLALQINANAMVTGTYTVVGKDQEWAADLAALGTPTYNPVTTTRPMDTFTGSMLEGGDPIAVVTEFSLTLNNTIAPRWVVGSKNTIKPSSGKSNLTGNISAYFEDTVLAQKFIDEVATSLELTLPDAAGNTQTYTLPRIFYNGGGNPEVSGEGPITLALPFQATLDTVTGTNVMIDRTPN